MNKNFDIKIGIEAKTKTVLNTILYRKGEIKVAITRDGNSWQIGRFTKEELMKLNETLSEYVETEMTDKNAKPTPGDESKGGNKASADQRKNWGKK